MTCTHSCYFVYVTSKIAAAQSLYNAIHTALASTLKHVKYQYSVVLNALNTRRQEIFQAKLELQRQRAAALSEVQAQQDNIDRLQRAYEAKEQPLQLNTTRLDSRTKRPNIELVSDNVQHTLIAELGDLEDAANQIRAQYDAAQHSLGALQELFARLSAQLEAKTQDLDIEDACISLRSLYLAREPRNTDYALTRTDAQWTSFGAARLLQAK
jgi:chromosome segregation ATPase